MVPLSSGEEPVVNEACLARSGNTWKVEIRGGGAYVSIENLYLNYRENKHYSKASTKRTYFGDFRNDVSTVGHVTVLVEWQTIDDGTNL